MNESKIPKTRILFKIFQALFKKFFPDDYVKRFLQADIRSDGRTFDEIRKIQVFTNINSTSFGSAIVKLGSTTLICLIEGSLAKKSLDKIKYTSEEDRQDKTQYFVYKLYEDIEVSLDKNVEYDSSRREKMLRESYLSVWLLKIVNNLFPELNDDLTIGDSLYYWKLVANIKVINFEGNFVDGALYALFSSLITVKLPEIDPNQINEKLLDYKAKSYRKLNLTEKDLYIPFTFKLIDSKHLILDSNHEEDDLSDADFTIIVQAGTNNFMIHKHNGHLIHFDLIKEKVDLCIKVAEDFGFKLADLFKDNVSTCDLN